MTALAKIVSWTRRAPELSRAREHAAVAVTALEYLDRAGSDPHVTALLASARQLLGAVEVEIERVGGGSRALVPITDQSNAGSLATACEQLAAMAVCGGGPGTAAVRNAARRLVVTVNEYQQQRRRLMAEVQRVASRALGAPVGGR